MTQSNIVDMTNELCTSCNLGHFVETSIHDDIDGVLHCSNCNKVISRYTTQVRNSLDTKASGE